MANTVIYAVGTKVGTMTITSVFTHPSAKRTTYRWVCDCGKKGTHYTMTGRLGCSRECLAVPKKEKKVINDVRLPKNVTKITHRKCRICSKALPSSRYFHHAECVANREEYRDFYDEVHHYASA